MRVEVGRAKNYKDKIMNLNLNKHSYWLDYQGDTPKLYSSHCPHQGGRVTYSEKEACFVCPVHQ